MGGSAASQMLKKIQHFKILYLAENSLKLCENVITFELHLFTQRVNVERVFQLV